MSKLDRKVKRNELRKQYGNKKMANEFKLYQIYKYGIGEYAKMQNKSVNSILNEEAK